MREVPLSPVRGEVSDELALEGHHKISLFAQ